MRNSHLSRADHSPEANAHVNTGSVTAVVVTFNSQDVIGECLSALNACSQVAHVIVVDNSNSDETSEIVADRFPAVQLIRNAENIGFGPANNVGLELVETEFGFVLNPDAIVNPKAIQALINVAAEQPNAAIIGPMLDRPGGSPRPVRTGSVWTPEKTTIPANADISVEFLVGAALFTRMSLIRRSGLFDPQLFLFYEDDEICRGALDAGYDLILTSRAVITHHVGKSTRPELDVTSLKQCHFTWSRLYVEEKKNGREAAIALATQQLSRIKRSFRLAKLLNNKTKQQLLKARQLGVHCFLDETTPPTSPDAYRNLNSTDRFRCSRTNKMQLDACDLCNQSEFAIISDKDRHGKPLDTAICTSCGLVRHAHIPSAEELQQFYSTNYRKDYNGESTPGSRRIMRAWNNGQRICNQVSPLLEPNSRVLEVGAGIGCTVKVFEESGFAAEGIDPGSDFLKFSRDKLYANVQITELNSLPQKQIYDAVLLVHVIEHLQSPKQALQYIAGLLKPGGMFYVECPNLQAPFARRSKLFHTAHIHNFVPSTLQMLAESCGFRLRKRFGDEQNPNLQMLFQHSGNCLLEIDKANYQRTVRELDRANSLPYHARMRYVTDRLQKLTSYATEHLRAKGFVKSLIGKFESNSPPNQAEQTQRAA